MRGRERGCERVTDRQRDRDRVRRKERERVLNICTVYSSIDLDCHMNSNCSTVGHGQYQVGE